MLGHVLQTLGVCALTTPLLISQVPQQSGTGTVRGIVVIEGTSDPIPEVQISLGGTIALAQVQGARAGLQAAMASFGSLLSAGTIQGAVQRAMETQGARAGGINSSPIYTATSGPDGRFSITNIPPGQYGLIAERDGYFGPSINGTNMFVARTDVTLTSQQTVEVKLALSPGAAVGGRILSPNGSPATAVTVEVLKLTYPNGLPTLQSVATKQTDDHGVYRFFRLAPGDYFLATTPRPILNIARRNSGQANDLVQVRTFYPGVTETASALSITLRPGEDVPGMNLQIQTLMGASVTGRVLVSSTLGAAPPETAGRGAGQRGRGSVATVTLVPRDRSGLADPAFEISSSALTTGPNDGAFRLANVPAGSYELFAAQNGLYGRRYVDVRGDVESITIDLSPGSIVKGRVLMDGRPANANARISLQAEGAAVRIPAYQQVGRFQPMIEQDGSFTIPSVPQGTYRFMLTMTGALDSAAGTAPGQLREMSPMTADTYVADIRQGGVSVYDNGFNVGTQEVTSLEVMIKTSGGRLEGTVVSPNLRPVESATVVLVPHPARRQNPALYTVATTTSQGTFVMSGVPPGLYKVFAFVNVPTGAYLNSEFIRKYEERGVSVSIAEGASVEQQVRVIAEER